MKKSVFYLENSCFKSGNSSGRVSTMLGWMLRMMRSSGALKSCEPRKKNTIWSFILYFLHTPTCIFRVREFFLVRSYEKGMDCFIGTLKLMGWMMSYVTHKWTATCTNHLLEGHENLKFRNKVNLRKEM